MRKRGSAPDSVDELGERLQGIFFLLAAVTLLENGAFLGEFGFADDKGIARLAVVGAFQFRFDVTLVRIQPGRNARIA